MGLYYKNVVSDYTSLGGGYCLLSFNGLNFRKKTDAVRI